jgi:methionine biosynthesis protein MetW
VIQGDADTDLALYPDRSFDYVILSRTIQAMRHPHQVIEEMLRIGRHGIVSFINYAHWRARWHLMSRGEMPMTRCLPDPWYSTNNIHPCTLEDFERLCDKLGLVIVQRNSLTAGGIPHSLARNRWFRNLLSEQALFVLSRPRSAAADALADPTRAPLPTPEAPARRRASGAA